MIKNLLTYRTGFLLKALLFLCLFLGLGTSSVKAQFAITEDFRNGGNPDIIIGGPGGAAGTATMTSGVQDPVGAGYLRLTNSETNQKGYAYVNKSFPSTMGVLVDFEYKMWRDKNDSYNGADGIGVFLYDATSAFQLGGYGGSLGYAPGPGSTTGLAGGYIGVGLDAYGNHSEAGEGRIGGPGVRPNSVVLRGITTANAGTTNAYLSGTTITTTNGTTFNYLDNTNTGTATQNALDYNANTATRPTDTQFYRRVQLEIVRLDAAGIYYNIIVRWKTSPTGPFVYITDYTTTDVPPALLKIGFAAASGGGVNYHEIRNLLVTTPGNLRVLKRADKDVLRTNNAANGTVTYTIEVTNATAFELNNVQFKDKFTDSYGDDFPEGTGGFDVTAITATGFVSASLPTVGLITTNEITGSLVIGAGQTGIITITGRLWAVPPGNILQNTATVEYPLDEDLNNNVSTVRTPVISENVDIIPLKTVSEQCIASGSTPLFTMRASNIGSASTSYMRLGNTGTRIALTNVVPPGYIYDDSSTPNGFAGTPTDAQSLSNTTARWSRMELLNTPSAGYTTYRYIARGTSILGAAGTLAAGATYPYPVTYTMTPPVGVTTYPEITTASYFTDANYNGSSEPIENRLNNVVTLDMFIKPVAPTVDSATLYYCLDEDAPLLTAQKTVSTNTLRWYVTPGGFSSEFPIKPYTGTTGNYTYYVSQVNGDCEGPTAAINVVVGPLNTGSVNANAATCPGSTITVDGTPVSSATFRWQSSLDGANWTIIPGATGEDYISGILNETTYFRRLTTVSANGKDCEGVTNWVRVFIADPGIIGNSQSGCSNINNPQAFSNVQAGTNGTINGVTYTYRWQDSTNGTTGWNDITGATGTTYDYSNGNVTTTRYFRRLVRYTIGGSTCSQPSNVVSLFIGNGSTPDQGTDPSDQTICYNATPATITSALGSNPGYFQWEVSTTNATTNFTVIPDASPTSGSYSPGPLTQTTWYRRKKFNGCNNGTVTGHTVQITVSNPAPGSIGNPQTLCYGQNPAALTSPQSGATGYRWEYADGTSGGTWQPMAGTGATITPPGPLTMSRRYRRFTVIGLCESAPTLPVTITVKQLTTAGVITGAQNICNGGAPATITGTQATSDDTIAYEWRFSANGSTGWGPASGTNNAQNYTPPATGGSGFYLRRATTSCGFVETNIVLVTVQNSPGVGTLGGNQTICNNTIPTQITGTPINAVNPATISYRWESSANSGGPFTIAAGTSNGQNYTPPALTATTYFRRVVISTLLGNTCESVSSPVTITVMAQTLPGTVSSSQIICKDTQPTVLGTLAGQPATGTGPITYQWQSSNNGVSNWNNINLATGETYQPPVLSTTMYYARLATATSGGRSCVSGLSNVITITVADIPLPGSINSNQTICNGGTPGEITSSSPGVVTPGGVMSYVWQSSTDNISWSGDIPGANGPTYTPPDPLTQTMYYKRFTIATYGTNICRSASSTNSGVVNVTLVPQPGQIGGSQTVCSGGNPTQITNVISGSGSSGPSYRWESSPNGAAPWTVIPGEVNPVYQPPNNITATIHYRRFTITTNNGAICTSPLPSNVVIVTVPPIPTPGTISAAQTICYGTAPAQLITVPGQPATGTGTITYQWQSSNDGVNNWTNIALATGETYQPGPLNANIYYRRLAVANTCPSAGSNAILITVRAQVQGGTVNASQTICSGSVPNNLTSAGPGSGPGGVTYRWDVSTDNVAWSSTGVTTLGYNFPAVALTTTRYYRRTAISATGSCEGYSNTIVITVVTAPTGGSVTADQTICYNSAAATITSTGAGSGAGGFTYRWDVSTNSGSTWGPAGATTADFTPPGLLTATTYYRRATVPATGSCEAYSNTIIITVLAQTTQGALTANQNICKDTAPLILGSGTAGTGSGTLTYRWERSDNGTTGWTVIPGETSASYQPPVITTAAAYFRRTTISTTTVGLATVVCESPPTVTLVVTTKNCKIITNPMIYQRVN